MKHENTLAGIALACLALGVIAGCQKTEKATSVDTQRPKLAKPIPIGGFGRFDLNKDGKIAFDEYMLKRSGGNTALDKKQNKTPQDIALEAKINKDFNAMDSNSDKVLSKEEFGDK